MTVGELEVRMDSSEMTEHRALQWLKADAARMGLTLDQYIAKFASVLGAD